MNAQMLFLNDELVDLDDDTKIAVTLQANDVAELQDRQANFTQSFTLPITDKNRRIIEASEQVFSDSFLPYRQIKAKVVASGIEVISDGVAILEEAEKKYRLSVYSGLTDFFKKIDGLNLADIDFTSVGLPASIGFRWANLVQLWTAPATADVILPLYQNGNLTDNSRLINLNKHFRPAVSFRKIVEAIFAFGEYTFSGEIFSDVRLQRLFLPIVEDKLKYSKQFIECNAKATCVLLNDCVNRQFYSNVPAATNFLTDNLYQPIAAPESNDPNNFVTTPFSGIASKAYIAGITRGNCSSNNIMSSFSQTTISGAAAYNAPDSWKQMSGIAPVTEQAALVFRAPIGGTYNIKIVGNIFHRSSLGGDSEAGYSYVNVRVKRLNGTEEIVKLVPTDIVRINEEKLFAFSLDGDIPLYRDEPIWIEFEPFFITYINFDNLPYLFEAGFSKGTKIEVALKSDSVQLGLDITGATSESGEIDLAGNLPNISMKNFLKAFAQMFGLILLPDAQSKDIRFVQFKEIVDNCSRARDWSDKFATDDVNVKFRLNEYGRTNNMKYLEDDNVTSGFGDSSFEIDDDNLQASKDVITLPFAASEQTTTAEGISMSVIRFVDNNNNAIKPKPRVFYAYKTTADASSNDFFLDVYTSNNNLWNRFNTKDYFKTYFVDDELNNLAFGNSLIQENYLELIASLQKTKIVTVELRLNATDVANFDFSIPVYFRQFAAYFYVNKISNWIDGKSCKVELLRIA